MRRTQIINRKSNSSTGEQLFKVSQRGSLGNRRKVTVAMPKLKFTEKKNGNGKP